jgi:Domain of Unknown Function (DUF748)
LSRRLTVILAAALAMLILGGVALLILPEIVRRVAVAQIPKLTGRAASIGRVELNLFTGRFAITGFSMARHPGQGPDAFIQFERLAGRIAPGSLLRSEIRLVELSLSRPIVRVTRTGPAAFDFSDILERFAAPAAPPAPSRWTVALGKVAIADGVLLLTDASLSPPEQWRLDGLGAELSGLSTKRGQPPGRLRLQAGLGPTKLRLSSDSVVLAPLGASLDVSVADFDLARVRPYLPATLPAAPQTGTVRLDLRLARVGTADLAQATVSGEVSVDGLSVLQHDRPTPFLTLDHLRVAITSADLLASRVALDAIEADGLEVNAARDRTGRIDLLAAFGGSDGPAAPAASSRSDPPANAAGETPSAPPSSAAPRKVTLDRLTLKSGTVTLRDDGVSPAREWKIEGMTIDGAHFSTSPDDAPATARVRAQITTRSGLPKPATLAVDADSIRLAPLSATARVSLEGLALGAIEPYWPATVPVAAPGGSMELALTASVESGDAGLRRADVSGTVRGLGLTVTRRGATTPFLTVPKLTVNLKQVDAVARTAALGAVEVEGADLVVMRDALGRISLLDLATAAQPAVEVVKSRTGLGVEESPPAKPTPAAAPAGPEWRASVDRFALAKGRFTFEDDAVSPRASLIGDNVAVLIERLSWPFTTPASFSFSVSMPGGGQTQAKGTAVLEPLNVHIALSTRDSPIEPYQAYLPFAARLHGLFSGDSQNEVQRGPAGELILASRGDAWARALEVRAPGGQAPIVHMDEMEISGIDFAWPNYALIERVTLRHPEVQIERDAQGAINLRTLFEVPKDRTPSAAASAESREPPQAERSGGGTAASAGGTERTVIDFTDIEIADGYLRFIDRTTSPAFSQEVSRLGLKVHDLSNVFGRPKRTTLTAQALLGSDGALDMRGELSGLGEVLRADLIVEVRDYALPGANPYAESLTSWVIQRGKLQAKIHYRIEGDRISAEHDLDFKGLRVAKARESDLAQRRIGVPLGLAVALLKDSHGDIDFSIPLHGVLSDKSFNWGEAMWAGVKQVITKLLLAPFRSIGRLFTGGGDAAEALEINPVTFAPGSSVMAPAMETQLTRVADFLRRSPVIKLALASVVTAADAESLRMQAVTARLQELRRARDLPDLAAALALYYQERLPDVAPPPTVDERLAQLAEREPLPAGPLAELAQRRLAGARERLVTVEGIPADRLTMPAPAPAAEPAPTASGEGRVEFTIEADQ